MNKYVSRFRKISKYKIFPFLSLKKLILFPFNIKNLYIYLFYTEIAHIITQLLYINNIKHRNINIINIRECK